MRRLACLLLAALLSGSCGNPASPSDGPTFSGPYTLFITPGAGCSAVLSESWLTPVQFGMTPGESGGTWRFSLPNARVDPENPAASSGDLSIDLKVDGLQAAGTIGGWGLASDASRTLTVRAGAADLGRAALAGSLSAGCPASVTGQFEGVLGLGTYRLSMATECASTTHQFVLRAAPT